MSYGWLSAQDLPPFIAGVIFDPKMPTRREEYWLAFQTARKLPVGSVVLDAGAGATGFQHVLPVIMTKLGHGVVALDQNPDAQRLTYNPGILRGQGDICNSELPGSDYDLVVCISVLEHIEPEERMAFGREALRLLKPKGLLCVTADETTPEELLTIFPGFDFGPREPEPALHLSPRVGFAVGRKAA